MRRTEGQAEVEQQMFSVATLAELEQDAVLDLRGWARLWRKAISAVGPIFDGIVRFGEPYYADAARARVLLEQVPRERRTEVALTWHSRGRRIV